MPRAIRLHGDKTTASVLFLREASWYCCSQGRTRTGYRSRRIKQPYNFSHPNGYGPWCFVDSGTIPHYTHLTNLLSKFTTNKPNSYKPYYKYYRSNVVFFFPMFHVYRYLTQKYYFLFRIPTFLDYFFLNCFNKSIVLSASSYLDLACNISPFTFLFLSR